MSYHASQQCRDHKHFRRGMWRCHWCDCWCHAPKRLAEKIAKWLP